MNVNRMMLALTLGLLSGCGEWNYIPMSAVDAARAECAERGGVEGANVWWSHIPGESDRIEVVAVCKDGMRLEFETIRKED